VQRINGLQHGVVTNQLSASRHSVFTFLMALAPTVRLRNNDEPREMGGDDFA
jgi:hypothetical protein